MAGFCTYLECSKYTSRRFTNCFTKKLLVVLWIVSIVAMCLPPVEARNLPHKHRHQRHQPESHTKEPRRWHHRKSKNIAEPTKETLAERRPKSPIVEAYENATRKIVNKMNNTRDNFLHERRKLNWSKEYRDGMPKWLPSVNFVEVHIHKYNKTSVKVPLLKRKFMYIMPKLLKSLLEYKKIFELLQKVQFSFTDNPYNEYKEKRKHFIQTTLDGLISTIEEIKENMMAVDMEIPVFDDKRMNLAHFELNVRDSTKFLKNDNITFRAYGNLLINWGLELSCAKSTDRECRRYRNKLRRKRTSRLARKSKNLKS